MKKWRPLRKHIYQGYLYRLYKYVEKNNLMKDYLIESERLNEQI